MSGAPALVVQNLTAGYGGATILSDLSVVVNQGSVTAVIGPNGAGKTTMLRAISGAGVQRSGTVVFDGVDLVRMRAHEIVARGVVHCPERAELFPRMTVRENLLMGAFAHRGRADLAAGLGEVYALFPRLRERNSQPAGTLSGGERQMVAIGRCLMAAPRLILLDEPSLGLAPQLVRAVGDALSAISENGATILLVEQNVALAVAKATYVYVLEEGRIVAEGAAEEVRGMDRVRRAYLGD